MKLKIHKRINEDSTYYALYDTETWKQVVVAETEDTKLNENLISVAFYSLDKKGYYEYMMREHLEELKPPYDMYY